MIPWVVALALALTALQVGFTLGRVFERWDPKYRHSMKG